MRLHDLPADDDFVLAGRPLRPGTPLERTCRFAEDVWRLDPGVLQQHATTLVLDFTTVPARYRMQAKQLCHAMLSGPLPAGEKRQNIASVHRVFGNVRIFLQWLDSGRAVAGRPPRLDLAALTGQDLADFYRYLLGLPGTLVRDYGRAGVRMLWRYRSRLSDPLLTDPGLVDSWTPRSGRGENSTDRIPESVLGPLITWALRFVDQFAPDVLTAQQHQRDYHARARVGRRNGQENGVAAALRSFLDSHMRHARPLPGNQGHPNMQVIAVEIGCSVSVLHQRYRDCIRQAADTVGVTDYVWTNTPIHGLLDGAPWINDIALHLPSRQHRLQSVRKLARMLHIACYIVIAFLSGMRDCEIKHLRRGSVTAVRDADGRAYRWTVTSLAFKGETDPVGALATWVVGQPAARAVGVLEQLQPTTQPLLFAPLPHGTTASRPDRAQATGVTNHYLNDFRTWINNYCATHGRDDHIPLINGLVRTRLTTRQFRRTLAWFIARRPDGSIAGAIQYRHLSVQMFEGYAGTSDSGFRAEVEAEQALARGEHLLAMTDAHEHAGLAGPAAEEAARRLGDFAATARFSGTVLTDARRLERLMRRHDPAIYPGTFATCVFNPDKALCQQHRDTRGTTHPIVGNCQPLECANVALTADNLDALQLELDQITAELSARPGLPPLLVHRLRDRHEQITQYLDRHAQESSTS
ncbi:hypothetical protein [Lentzea pudingi]|uniref:hypothetical protein n=1 Tax=Lentzea pudingi TaxID=1789439 RepID=UPI00166485EA|nr:hypothetical protein [Lentzea pudingi]